MSRIRGVIFDVDGTLVDSNDAHAWSWVDVFNENGHDATFDEVRALIGMGGDKLMPEAIGVEEDTPEGKAMKEARTKRFMEKFLPELRAFPGSRDMLLKLKEDGYQLVVATSARKEEMDPLLEKADAQGIFEEKTSSSDADNSKPDPDIIEAALEKLGLPPEACVMVGDTPYDQEAARKAGVPFIGFRSGGYEDKDFPGALAVFDGPADLLARYDTSPLAKP
jgi:HAD superfamily hydrolase (TIGR01509 family)